MRYFCSDCGRQMWELGTPGDRENHDLICPGCAKKLWKLIRAKLETQRLQEHFKRIP